jgi:alginate O-acetyltransferase complex protein AlgI
VLFSEPAFLFAFLPALLGVYFAVPHGLRNVVLTFASLGFYALGEWRFLPFMLASIAINYGLAIWIERTRERRQGPTILAIGIFSDLALLVVFKYAGWLAGNLDAVLGTLGLGGVAVPSLALPLGISFFTFHKISYKIDVYRGVSSAQRNPLTLALYILFFPQLIAGPIVRYHDIADQLDRRTVTSAQFADGIRRIIIGLAKKMLIANSVAVAADAIFRLPTSDLGPAVAWVGIVCYTLQIYFDFSGYSDMAIGFAKLFGFTFLENFEHPYVSQSITEFWRRWHISLSRWFRDYLYIPLGGNRTSERRTYVNLMVVFLLCGLWHGASWVFVAWGAWHGAFLVIERLGLGARLVGVPRPIRHAYTLAIVIIGWVLFRATTLEHAVGYLGAMLGLGGDSAVTSVAQYLDAWTLTMIGLGLVFATPVRRRASQFFEERGIASTPTFQIATMIGLFGLFFVSLLSIAADTYNPFLYFRF